MTDSRKIYYWSIQIIVWGLLSGAMGFGYWVSGNDLKMEPWQIVMDFSFVAVLSIIMTHQLRRALNKWIEFDNLSALDGFKIIGLLIIASILFYLLYISYTKFIYTYIYDRADVFNHPSQNWKNNILFFINYTIYFLIWMVFYVGVKGLMELNKSRETRLELEGNLKESQLNSLKGQINPHFMFNTLNNIRGLMLEDVDKARHMLTNLSETLRYSLTKSEVDAIALEDELEMVENYVEISKIQFDERLNFETNIDENSLNKQIPPMIIQMLVENAIKHGISSLKKGGKVVLSTLVNDTELEIKVFNSGKLHQAENTTQLGLENIKRRLGLLYGEKATFTIKELNNEVIATIKIPLI